MFGWGGERKKFLFAVPYCRNGLEQGDTGKDAIVLAFSLRICYGCQVLVIEVQSMSKIGTVDANYLGLLMPLEGVTTDSRFGCLKRKAVRINLQIDVRTESKWIYKIWHYKSRYTHKIRLAQKLVYTKIRPAHTLHPETVAVMNTTDFRNELPKQAHD